MGNNWIPIDNWYTYIHHSYSPTYGFYVSNIHLAVNIDQMHMGFSIRGIDSCFRGNMTHFFSEYMHENHVVVLDSLEVGYKNYDVLLAFLFKSILDFYLFEHLRGT